MMAQQKQSSSTTMFKAKLQLIVISCFFPAAISFTTVNSPLITTGTSTSLSQIPLSLRVKPCKTPCAPSLSRKSWSNTRNIWSDAGINGHRIAHPTLFSSQKDESIEADVDIIDKKTRATNRNSRGVQGIHPMFLESLDKLKASMKHPTHKALSVMAAAFIMLAVIFTPLSEALAAPSGGRMGGSFGGGSSRQSYSRSYSSSPRSYNRGFSQGYTSGYYSRPSITVAPTIGGWGYNPYYYSPAGVVVSRGPSIVDVFIFGAFALVIYNAMFKSIGDTMDGSSSMSALGEGVSVAQISVALNIPNKDSPSSILNYLNRLSQTARTDSRMGVSNLVSQGKIL